MAARDEQPPEVGSRRPEAWQAPEAAHSRLKFGWGVALFVVALIVLPIVAKFFHWF